MPRSHPSILKFLNQIPQELHDFLVRTGAAIGHGAPQQMPLEDSHIKCRDGSLRPSTSFFGGSSYWQEIRLTRDDSQIYFQNMSNCVSLRSAQMTLPQEPGIVRARGEAVYPKFQKQHFFKSRCLDMSSHLNSSHRTYKYVKITYHQNQRLSCHLNCQLHHSFTTSRSWSFLKFWNVYGFVWE